MGAVQEVSIPEYFSEMRRSQTEAVPKNRYLYAREYMNNRCGLNKEGSSFVTWLNKMAEEKNTPVYLFGAGLALKELNLRIEEDLLEFAAEMGVRTLEALKNDKNTEEARYQFFHRYGYSHQKDPSNISILTDDVDLHLVRRNQRGTLWYIDRTNPFLGKMEDPFVPTDVLPFSINGQPVTVNKPDWDNLSEKEWQDMKEAEAEERLQLRLKREKDKTTYKQAIEDEKRAQRALDLVDEYPGCFWH